MVTHAWLEAFVRRAVCSGAEQQQAQQAQRLRGRGQQGGKARAAVPAVGAVVELPALGE